MMIPLKEDFVTSSAIRTNQAMKKIPTASLLTLYFLMNNCTPKPVNFDNFPATVIANEEVRMKLYLPDPEKGLYRATRFDWSGVIGSVQYRGHEYFGYWKDTHDPTFHEDLPGPVEGFIEPGLGYTEAKPGEGFIRIGVGVLEKPEEAEYQWTDTYKILDHGTWKTERGDDWISFRHQLQADNGYGYEYTKTIRLKADGFTIEHELHNNGQKTIETDQFNHNFLMIDGEKSGPAFRISFPYPISTQDDTRNLVELQGNDLVFLEEFNNNSVFLKLEGHSQEVADHRVTVINQKTGAAVTFTVDKPLYRMAFWACETTLSPENFIWLSVAPGQVEKWISEYTLEIRGKSSP